MRKQAFLDQLRGRLGGIPEAELNERLTFYSEAIDDRVEEGLTEEEAVAAMGSVEEIAEQIIAEIPLAKLAKERIKPKRRLGGIAILLVILGSPIWLSLAVAAAAVMLSLYAVLWSLVASLWAVFAAVAVCAPAGIAAGILFACSGNFPALLSMIAAAMICGGMAIFLFFGCRAATKGAAWMTKGTIISIKRCFIRKENA
jgi:uncharacterized membrane protein